jgi:hypothetical protein
MLVVHLLQSLATADANTRALGVATVKSGSRFRILRRAIIADTAGTSAGEIKNSDQLSYLTT